MAESVYGSRDNLRRRPTVNDSVDAPSSFYQPGQPIGFLKARGTPYQKKYLSKKLGFCCLFIAPIVGLVSLAITLLPVLYAVANHALHTSVLHIYQSNITSPGNTSFPLTLEGQVKKTGIFPAHLYFREPVNVYWVTPPPELKEVHIGRLKLDYIGVAVGHGRIKQATNFEILDQATFSTFSKYLITQEAFTWKLNCSSVHVKAFSFLPTYKNLVFSKHVNFKGFNNFENVKILDFQLPGDDPKGGVTLQVTTSLDNPSPFGVEVGTLALGLYYKNMYLGPAQVNNVNITAGRNVITLAGRLVPHTNNQTELDLLGELFTAYINGDIAATEARGVSVTRPDGQVVAWLSDGISVLKIAVPLQAPEPINPIKSITIKTLSLAYTPETAYNPTTFSNALSAQIGLPFGFSLNIASTANTINLLFNGAKVATIDGAFSNSSTKLDLISAGQTAGTLDLTLPPTPLTLPNNTDAAKRELENFQTFLVNSDGTGLQLQGSAKAITDTPLGRVLLNGIKFKVDSGLLGLDGLTRYPTVINSVDVTGGIREGLQLAVGTSLVNPSNLNLSVGDNVFQLSNQQVLGTVTLPNLNLKIGQNNVNATSLFTPNVGPKGYETLNRFISGQDTLLHIDGFDRSSNVASLAPALSTLRLNATLPGLKSNLVQMANLSVLDTTGIENDMASSIVSLGNPFTSSLKINHIKANVTSHGIFLAHIDTPLDFKAAGKATTQSPNVPLNLNLYPPDIFALVRALAVKSNQDPAYIDVLVQLAGYKLTPTTSANSRRSISDGSWLEQREVESESLDFDQDSELQQTRRAPQTPEEHVELAREIVERGIMTGLKQKRANMFTGFNLPTYIDRAFSAATVNLEIVSEATIGEYTTTLNFPQTNVPLGHDATLFKLLPILAQPIVQKLVDASVLGLERITIKNPQQNAFQTALQGSIKNAGPFDAVIEFTQGLGVFWEGRQLGQLAFPNITLQGDVGANLDLQTDFAVADVGFLTEFTKYLLTQPSFVWNIAGKGLRVDALGISVPNITISKDVILTGFNGLKGNVKIESFDLPSNDPAGGIRLTAQSTIYNPSQVGVQLSRFGVNIARNGTVIGPSAAADPFTLEPLTTTRLPLSGRLIRQTSDSGLAVLSEIFTNFVHNVDTQITVKGDYAGPESVTWLNDGIKSLSIDVQLPAQKFDVIKSISLNQLSLYFTPQTAWSPSTSSSNTTSQFFLPFAFPLEIVQVGGGFITNYQNQNAAVLNIPPSPSTTDIAARILTLMFTNVPFSVYRDKHSVFSQFLADTTANNQVTFNLNGKANTKASTAAGLVSITDVPFNVDTTIPGLQNLNARPVVVSDLDVFHGYSNYLLIKTTATLFNPSAITIGTGDVSFDLYFNNRKVGTAVIQRLVLVPGVNNVPTEVHFSPQGAENMAAGQLLLENYVQAVVSDTVIQGTKDTTPIESLKQALSGIQLKAQIPPLKQLLIQQASLVIPKDIAQTSIASTTFTLQNPFTASINLLQVKAGALYKGVFLGEINANLRNRVISAPGHSTITSYPLPFKFNLDPKNLIRFVAAAAAATGTDLGPLPPYFAAVLGMSNTNTTIKPYPDSSPPPCVSGKQFDVQGAVLKTLQGLKSTLNVASTLKLDDYQTQLDFVQDPVPTKTDETALYLLGPAGAPIVQNIVNQATLTVSIANVTSVTNSGFDVSLQGQLLGTGPFDAYIEFPEPLTVTWQGNDIATLSLPPICAFADVGVPDLRMKGALKITNLGRFTDFSTYILKNPSFQWTVSSKHVRVRSLGITFSDVILSKDLDFKAFNGLPGITISDFDIPSETGNALNIQTNSLIPSSASLGIQLDTAYFEIFFKGTDVGPVRSTNLFLAALATTSSQLTGQITRKSSSKDLANIGVLFSNFLQGVNQTIQVKGQSVVTEANGNQPVNWLTASFRTLTLDVTLPGKVYQIIFSITISDLTVQIGGDPANSYNIPSSSNSTIATFSNPFHFSLQPLQTATEILLSFAGGETASLSLPRVNVNAGASRGPNDFQVLQLNWRNQPIVARDRANFQQFFAQITDKDRGTFDMRGGADVLARTVIGDIPITGIPLNVTTSLAGINSFNGVTTVSDVRVASGTKDYLLVPLTVTLSNPSNLTVISQEISLPVIYKGVFVGRAEVSALRLLPGDNLVPSSFYYAPANANDSTAQNLLQTYVQPSFDGGGPLVAPLLIDGSVGPRDSLTAYDSLRPALAGVKLTSELKGIGSRIVTGVDVFVSLQTLIEPYVEIIVHTKNELDTNLYMVGLQTSAKAGGSLDASDPDAKASYTFPTPFETPSKGTATSPRVPKVLLAKGLIPSLTIIGKPLNLFNNLPIILGPSASSGYLSPGLEYDILQVPSTYYLDLGGDPIKIPIPNSTDDFLGWLAGALGGGGITSLLTNLISPNNKSAAGGDQNVLICGLAGLANGLSANLLNGIINTASCGNVKRPTNVTSTSITPSSSSSTTSPVPSSTSSSNLLSGLGLRDL